MTQGLHLLHKPVGPTSFSLVKSAADAQLKAQPNRRPRVCHGGALDPFAHGLLILLAGQGTKLFDHLHAVPKVYEGTIRWGTETDNGDPLGKVVSTGDASALTAARLDEALAAFVGWHEQVPPATSNKRVGGVRAYTLAHSGQAVDLPPQRVYLHEAAWLGHDLPRESRVRLTVRGGYYVRSLAHDLGRALGCGAHLGDLRRTAIGPHEDPGEGRQVAVAGRGLLPWLASRDLTQAEVGVLRQKGSIDRGDVRPADWPLPAAFVEPGAEVRGFFKDKLAFLLREQGGQLVAVTEFGGGI